MIELSQTARLQNFSNVRASSLSGSHDECNEE